MDRKGERIISTNEDEGFEFKKGRFQAVLAARTGQGVRAHTTESGRTALIFDSASGAIAGEAVLADLGFESVLPEVKPNTLPA